MPIGDFRRERVSGRARRLLKLAALAPTLACAAGTASAQQAGLLRPSIVEPVHEGAGAVYVESIQRGSEVTLVAYDADGEPTRLDVVPNAAGPVRLAAPWDDPVDALRAGRDIAACASRSGVPIVCSERVEVRPRPTRMMAAPVYEANTVFYMGAGCVGALASGLLPGAEIALVDPTASDPLLAIAEFDPFRPAALAIPDPFWPRSTHALRLEARLGGQPFTTQARLPPLTRVDTLAGCERRLEPPAFPAPVAACRPVVALEGLVPGARYGIEREGDAVLFGPRCATAPTAGSRLGGLPLPGDALRAGQEMPGASLASCGQARIDVVPAGLPPVVIEPVSAGDTTLSLRDAIEGAILSVEVVDATGAVVRAYADIPVAAQSLAPLRLSFAAAEAFAPGQTIRVIARIVPGENGPAACAQESVAEVPVGPAPTSLPAPQIVEPVHACMGSVVVRGRLDRASATVLGSGPILSAAGETNLEIGRAAADRIPLHYALEAGWSLVARQSAGGVESGASTAVTVAPAPDLGQLVLDIRGAGMRDLRHGDAYVLDACRAGVHVLNGPVGAQVDVVRTERETPGGAMASAHRLLAQGVLHGSTDDVIALPAASLLPGDRVVARPTLCGRTSEVPTPSNVLRAVHALAIDDKRLATVEIPDAGGRLLAIDIGLGCPAQRPLAVTLASDAPDVVEIVDPASGSLTIARGATSARIVVRAKARGRAVLSAWGPHVVARPAAAGLGATGLAEVRVFAWSEPQTVRVMLHPSPSPPAYVVPDVPYGGRPFEGAPDAASIVTGRGTRVLSITNTSGGQCSLRLLEALGPPENPCVEPVPIAAYVRPEGAPVAGIPTSVDLTTRPGAPLPVDRTWFACSVGDPCDEDDVGLRLEYEALVD
ncbi:hypothetical protein [Salinarimonas rosea]|uniref:hypothetical protein n=1 Tax=Salinarimonas rosea TaxID=552063 RepID=UPI00048EC0C6|nr:hypothetical protein [Salinarimonas rosea]